MLRGTGGMEVEILSYGAAVRRLALPNGMGGLVDVVLGHETMDAWEHRNDSYFGVIAGRVAGRIPSGHLAFDGQTYQLPCNDRGNHLHGGEAGLAKRLWTGAPFVEDDGTVGLRMHYTSVDGEGNYPGTLELTITYLVTPDNALVFETEAQSDQTTPFTLAQHSYFNLAGESSGSAQGHVAQIFSDHVMATDETMTPLGYAESVDGKAADLRQARPLADVIPGLPHQHGDIYQLKKSRELALVARFMDPVSGRSMDVSTTHDYLQFYTAAHLDGSLKGKNGTAYPKHAGMCFECQGYPDPAAGFGDILVRPDQVQRHTTVYAFSHEELVS
jgi:aldose 1-epimerase